MYGSYRKPRELLWILGCLIYLTLMGEAFFGYLLPWGQMSLRAAVIVNLFSTVPFIGEGLGVWIRGDYTISDITLNRFFAPRSFAGCPVVAHLMALHEVGSNNPDGIEIKQQPKDPVTGIYLDGIYSHPYYTIKDLVGVVVFLAVFSAIMFFVPRWAAIPRGQQLHPRQSAADAGAHRAGVVLHAVLRDAARGAVVLRLAASRRAGDGRVGGDFLLHALSTAAR
jgi:quinol-cytochrome oxidoreductase complex cytochrome b subunit